MVRMLNEQLCGPDLFVARLGSDVRFTESGCALFLAGPAEQGHLSELRQIARVLLNWGI